MHFKLFTYFYNLSLEKYVTMFKTKQVHKVLQNMDHAIAQVVKSQNPWAVCMVYVICSWQKVQDLV